MQPCILCLPITLPSEVKLGLVLTPFTVAITSELAGLSSVCCVNLTGLRYKGMRVRDVTHRFDQFRKLMVRLGLSITHYWADNNPHHVERLQSYCETLANAGVLQLRSATTLTCKCSAVEVVEEVINSDWSMERKVIDIREGQPFCKLCNTQLRGIHRECLFLDTLFSGNPLVAVPNFYQKEIDTLQESFNQPLLVSRQRKIGYELRLFDRTWRLDIDFCWSMLFCSLIEDGFESRAVVVSSRSLKPLVWAYGVSRKLRPDLGPVTALITPYVQFEVSDPTRPVGSLAQLLDRYGRTSVRLLMASGLKWEQKEVTAKSSLLFWALKGLARDSVAIPSMEKTIVSLKEAVLLADGHEVDKLIADLRKLGRVELSTYHNLLLEKGVSDE